MKRWRTVQDPILWLIRIALAASVMLVAIGSASAADQDQKDCEATEPDRAIHGCSELLKRGSTLPPKLRAQILLNRAESWLALHKRDEALVDAQQAVAADPKSARAHALRGQALGAGNQHKEAIAAFDRAIDLDRSDVAARMARGRSFEALGDRDKALADFNEAVKTRFGKPQPYIERGRFYLNDNQLGLARADFDKAVEYGPKLAAAFYWRAVLNRKEKDQLRALEDLNAALFLDPKDTSALLARAEVHESLGNAGEAKTDFQRVASGDPFLPEVIKAKTELARLSPVPGTGVLEPAKPAPSPQPALAALGKVLKITSPATGAVFSGSDVTITYELQPPAGLVLTGIDVLVDGQQVMTRGAGRSDLKDPGKPSGTIAVPLPRRDVEIALVARAGDRVAEPERLRLIWGSQPAIAQDDILKPKLYVLSIGIADYVDPDLRLQLAARDAEEFARALKAQAGGIYARVETRVLLDRDATRANVIRGLEWLKREVTSRDVAMVFLAGHGVAKGDGFWFLPADVAKDELSVSAVSTDNLKTALKDLPSKTLLFLDACHAGKALSVANLTRGIADVKTLVDDLGSAENSLVAFASSTGRELSQESPEWGHGAFTKALIEAISEGRADPQRSGSISVKHLDAYVSDRVKALTNGSQHTQMRVSEQFTDFPIAVTPR